MRTGAPSNPPLILAFEDDGCVHVYQSLDAVVLQVEAMDAEDCLLAVFDDRGQRYVIDWIEPNKRGFFGVTNGRYRLLPSGDPDPQALALAVDEVGSRGLAKDDLSTVEAIRRKLDGGA